VCELLQPVHLESLKLTKFRNHASLELELDARHVVMTGELKPYRFCRRAGACAVQPMKVSR